MNINYDDALVKIAAQMEKNIRSQAVAQNLSDEEVEATMVLNKKKIAEDAQKLANFFNEAFAETEQA